MNSGVIAIILGLISLVGIISGAIGAFAVQWYKSRQESPKIQAEAKKSNAEAEKTAADAWHALYDEVCQRLEILEQKCEGLKSLVADVEQLKSDNRRLRNKVNMIIHWYNRLYHQALDAGLNPEYEPPELEEIDT